jgi:hypothetical protein
MILKNIEITEELAENTTIVSMRVPEKLDQEMQAMYDSTVQLSLTVSPGGGFAYTVESIKGTDDLVVINRIILERLSDCMDTLEDYLHTKYHKILEL